MPKVCSVFKFLFYYLLLLSLCHEVICDVNDTIIHRQFRRNILNSFINANMSNGCHSDVLAIVHMNFAASLAQTQLYIQTWSPFLPHMVLFGNWDHAQLVELHKHNIPAIRAPENEQGYLSQNVFLRGVESFLHPQFKGYLYIHDDLVVSPKKLMSLDKSKFWVLQPGTVKVIKCC